MRNNVESGSNWGPQHIFSQWGRRREMAGRQKKIGQRNITGKKKGYERERALGPALTLEKLSSPG